MSDDLRKLAEAATPGPWMADEWHGSYDGGWRAVGPLHEQPENDEPDCDAHQRAKRDSAFIAAANPTAILALLDRLAAVEAERDAAFDRGRAVGREDVGKYSHAIGQIEGVLGIAGAVPLGETVEAVRRLRAERDRLRSEREWYHARWEAEMHEGEQARRATAEEIAAWLDGEAAGDATLLEMHGPYMSRDAFRAAEQDVRYLRSLANQVRAKWCGKEAP